MALSRSPDRVLLLHNPRCSKSRAARALLEARGIPFEDRLYLDAPLSREELEDLRERLSRPPWEWLRRGEAVWRQLGLSQDSEPAALLDAMASHPILMERPILVLGDRAVVGRPTDAAAEFLDAVPGTP
ncbi:MAG: ArsC/Spx/MgsR family protein [Myxococcota bacterium]